MESQGEQSEKLRGAISNALPLYILPKNPVVEDVLIPALRASKSVDMMMGYFSSGSFAEIAPGLATFLRNSTAPMRMVIGPLLTDADFDTLTKDEDELLRFAKRIIFDDLPDEDLLALHTLECLAWLITQGRLSIRVAIMRGGLFHPKVWLFSDGHERAALHGSTNFTRKGLTKNIEQLTLSREWKGEESIFHIDQLRTEFDGLWNGGDKDCYVASLPDAIEQQIVERYKTEMTPDEDRIKHIWQKIDEFSESIKNDAPQESRLKVPSHLTYDSGDFAHQGRAVDSWFKSGRRGILEMATGAGKTITSMICATKLQDEIGKILVVVSAPYRPLIGQWCEEIREFGVQPINLSTVGGPESRHREIKQAGRRLRIGNSKTEILVVSNDTLCTSQFIESVSGINIPKLLIADECHNLGAASFTRNPPEVFDYRLGLSATPVRQYDEEGTEQLIDFFGDICFAFSLKEAIGTCLTEYDYHVHFVELGEDEMEEWRNLSDKISSQAWKMKSGQSDPYLENLRRERRLVLETARGKLDILGNLLDKEGMRFLKYTLIYATDKQPEQLDMVNQSLESRGVLFHPLTAEETQSRNLTGKILSSFQKGELQVLTAKRVLDEGVNIPQIKLAFILASTTVKRQWVQRRGRLLRKCKAIGKTHATIHDFVVLPPNTSSSGMQELDADARKLVRYELDRVWEFAHLSRNNASNGGPYEAVQYLQELANEKVMN